MTSSRQQVLWATSVVCTVHTYSSSCFRFLTFECTIFEAFVSYALKQSIQTQQSSRVEIRLMELEAGFAAKILIGASDIATS